MEAVRSLDPTSQLLAFEIIQELVQRHETLEGFMEAGPFGPDWAGSPALARAQITDYSQTLLPCCCGSSSNKAAPTLGSPYFGKPSVKRTARLTTNADFDTITLDRFGQWFANVRHRSPSLSKCDLKNQERSDSY